MSVDGPMTAPDPSRRLAWRVALATTLLGAAAALVLVLLSDGFYQDDDIAHYLFARAAWTNPAASLHWWARPGYNIPASVAARLGGFFGCRILSLLMTAATAYLAYAIAVRIGVRPLLAAVATPLLVWLQPLAMTLALTSLTETPAALYLALGTWLYLRGNRVWGCAAISAATVTRIETLPLTAVMAAFVLRDAVAESGGLRPALRRGWPWACVLAIIWAPAAYAVATIVAQVPPDASILSSLVRDHTDEYGSGRPWHFISCWLLASGLGVMMLWTAGAARPGRRAALPVALALGLVAVQTAIFMRGAFASGGYPRFLVPLVGLVAPLACAGLDALWAGRRMPALLAVGLLTAAAMLPWLHFPDVVPFLPSVLVGLGVAALGLAVLLATRESARVRLVRAVLGLASVLAAAQVVATVRPLTLASSLEQSCMAECMDFVRHSSHASAPAITTHPLVEFEPAGPVEVVADAVDAVRRWHNAKPGTLFYWDSKYGHWNADDDCPADLLGEQLRAQLDGLGTRIYAAERTSRQYGQPSALAGVWLRQATADLPATQPAAWQP